MAHKRKEKPEDDKPVTSHPTLSHRNSGGAGSENRPASFSAKREDRKPSSGFHTFWREVGRHTNDNPALIRAVPFRKAAPALLAAFLLMGGIALSMNSSEIAAGIVLHTDDKVLSAAMDANPDAVAALLNEMKVGE